jgi:surfeit locus 1 family protein
MPSTRPLTVRTVLPLLVGVAAAAVCVRLGVWQVSRLGERRAHNALLIDRVRRDPVPIGELSADTADGHYRLVTLSGKFSYPNEFAWAPRMRHGSPGVNLLTPMAVAGLPDPVIVNRGWAYSPDAKSVEFARWREGDSATVTGYVETWQQDCGASAAGPLPATCGDTTERVLRRLDRTTAERLARGPVSPYLVLQTSDSALRPDSIPARAEEPALDEGPHFNYAVQWFAFATIALVGGVALARREHRR